jgi:protein-S-isoprenylcysteine O-methyltransferase Ste14
VDLLALITIIIWPVVPLFWIPVHCATKIFRRLGPLTYLMPLITWIPLAAFFYAHREYLLSFKTNLPFAVRIAGAVLLLLGTSLHIWTGNLLGFRGLIGLPEISPRTGGRLVTEGPFSVVRHPTYLAHTVMFLGVFLFTGVIGVGAVTLLDFIMINLVVIPLEDRELVERFGKDYARYKETTPALFPRIFR